MKKYLFVNFCLLITVINIYSQTLEEREKQIALKNHIKSKTQIDYKYQGGSPVSKGIISSKTIYSHSGEILKVEILNSKGVVTGSENYEYDSNNNRTLYERIGANGTYKKISAFDEKNNLLHESGYNGAENFRNNFSYANSNQLQEAVYYINDAVQQKLVYKNSGNTTTVETYMGGLTLTSKIKLVYDSKGNLIEETTCNIKGSELEKKVYKYNTSGQLIEETKTQKGNFFYRNTYAYDTRGNLLKIYEETLSKSKYEKKVYTYDAPGNLTEYKWRRNPDEEFNIKTYTYDSKGICLTEHTLYPGTKFELLSKYEYEFY